MDEKIFYKEDIRGMEMYCGNTRDHEKCVDCIIHHLHTTSGKPLICHATEDYPQKYIDIEKKSQKALDEGKCATMKNDRISITEVFGWE